MIPEEKKSATEEKVEKLYDLRYEFWNGDQGADRDNEIFAESHKLSAEIASRRWDVVEDIVNAVVRYDKTVDELFCIFDILGIDYSK